MIKKNLAAIRLFQNLKDKLSNHDILSVFPHAMNYFNTDMALGVLAIISMSIFTRLLTKDDYGLLAMYISWIEVGTILLSLNLHAAVSRYYYEKTKDFGEFIGATLIIISLMTTIMIIVSILSYKHLIGWLELPGKLLPYLILSCIASIMITIYNQIIIPQKKSKEFAILKFSRGIATFGVSVVLVYLLSEDRYMGNILGSLFVSIGVTIYVILKIRTFTVLSLNLEHIKYILTYSLPLIPYALSSIILAQFDRIMIGKIINTAAVGIYSVGYTIGSLIIVFYSALDMASRPDFFKFMNRKEYKRWDVLNEQIFSITCICALGLILFSKEIIILLVAKEFHEAASVVPIVVIGYLFFATATAYGKYIGYEKKTIFNSANILVAGIVNVVLNAIFIPKYGYMAAAYTTAAGYFTWFLLCWITSKFILRQNITPLILIWRPIIYLFIFFGGFYLIQHVLENSSILFFIKITLMILFFCVLFRRNIKNSTLKS